MLNGTFLGRKMMQTERAVWLWEKILSQIEFKRIVEIGTSSGNFSLYLFLLCIESGARFYTYDKRHYLSKLVTKRFKNISLVKELTNFGGYFSKLNVFENEKLVADVIQQEGKTILFCDGGNKIREYNTFVKYLKNGDIVVVHDWMSEIFPEQLEYKLEPIFAEECKEEGMTKFFQK